jgi:hypothetical protein
VRPHLHETGCKPHSVVQEDRCKENWINGEMSSFPMSASQEVDSMESMTFRFCLGSRGCLLKKPWRTDAFGSVSFP